MAVKLLLAGQDELLSLVLSTVRQQHGDLQTIGIAASGKELVLLLLEDRPAVALVDLGSLPADAVATAIDLARMEGLATRFVGLADSAPVDRTVLIRLDAMVRRDAPVDRLLTTLQGNPGRKTTAAGRQPSGTGFAGPQSVWTEAAVEPDSRAGSDAVFAEGPVSLVVSPFDNFRSLAAFQHALQGLEGIRNVRVHRFHHKTLHVSAQYSGVLPLEERLKEMEQISIQVVGRGAGSLELRIGPEDDCGSQALPAAAG